MRALGAALCAACFTLWAASPAAAQPKPSESVAKTAKAVSSVPEAIAGAAKRYKVDLDDVVIAVMPLEGVRLDASGRSNVSTLPLRYGLNSERSVRPASTAKLVTTLVGLETLGAGFHWYTRFFADAEPDAKGRLKGNIYVRGGGDPTLVIEDFALQVDKLAQLGVKHITMVERFGIVCEGDERLNPAQQEMAKVTNREHMTGTLADAVKGADVFFGMSAPQVFTAEMVSTMAKDPMVFAMANPVPEIWPEDAKKGGAAVVGTGRSDYPNQINNVLAFPGIFRGALDVRASDINEEMKLAAAKAIAACVSDEELNAEYIMPMAFDKKVIRSVADAVAQAARDSGVARI